MFGCERLNNGTRGIWVRGIHIAGIKAGACFAWERRDAKFSWSLLNYRRDAIMKDSVFVRSSRMLSRLFRALVVVSLVLCIALVVIWMRSYRQFDEIRIVAQKKRLWQFSSGSGFCEVVSFAKWPYNETFSWRTRKGSIAPTGLPVGWLGSDKECWTEGSGSFIGVYSWGRLRVRYRPDGVPPEIGKPDEAWTEPFIYSEPANYFIYIVPYWVVVSSLIIPPFAWLVSIMIRRKIVARRLVRGLCLRCGYDLRCSEGRCPECGHLMSTGTGRVKTGH